MILKLRVPVRYYRLFTDQGIECNEKNFGYIKKELVIEVNEAALVLVDTWDRYYVGSWLTRAAEIVRSNIVPVTEAARNAGITIIHAPSYSVARKYTQWARYANDEDYKPRAGRAFIPCYAPFDWPPTNFVGQRGGYFLHGRRKEPRQDDWVKMQKEMMILEELRPKPEDFVVATGDQLNRLLKDKRILHLFYAGFATNWCLQYRDYGMRAMNKRGYNLILLRDCTTAVETHDTVDELLATRIAVREIEMQLGYSTSKDDVIKACQAISVQAHC